MQNYDGTGIYVSVFQFPKTLEITRLASAKCQELRVGSFICAVKLLSDSHKSKKLALCYALYLGMLSKQDLTCHEMTFVKDNLLRFIFLMKNDILHINDFELNQLPENLIESAVENSKKIFENYEINFLHINVNAGIIAALTNICGFFQKHPLNSTYSLKELEFKFLFQITFDALKKCASEETAEESKPHIPVGCYIIERGLHIIEAAVKKNATENTYLIQNKNVLHSFLTNSLGWSIKILFSTVKKIVEPCLKLHQSTLISILKILSCLANNNTEFDSFPLIEHLIENILIGTLKSFFNQDEQPFEILVLSLELLVYFIPDNEILFISLFYKSIWICNGKKVLAIEALIMMLTKTLKRLKEIKCLRNAYASVNEHDKQNSEDVDEMKNSKDLDESNFVQKTVLEHMEMTTSTAFIGILLTFYIKKNKNHKQYVYQKLPVDIREEAIDVLNKFLEFVLIWTGLPSRLLDQCITVLNEFESLHL